MSDQGDNSKAPAVGELRRGATDVWHFDLEAQPLRPDVIAVANALQDHRGGCDVRDGLMCADCLHDAQVAVAGLIRKGFLPAEMAAAA